MCVDSNEFIDSVMTAPSKVNMFTHLTHFKKEIIHYRLKLMVCLLNKWPYFHNTVKLLLTSSTNGNRFQSDTKYAFRIIIN